jgi:hypothetical protein
MIWYNPLKTTELMVAAAERQMIETGEKISERIGLLYGPLYAILAFSQVPELKSAASRRRSHRQVDVAAGAAVLSADPVAVRGLRQRRFFHG